MSMSIEECMPEHCAYCGEQTVDPFSGVCWECGHDQADEVMVDEESEREEL